MNAKPATQRSAVFTITAYCLHGTTASGHQLRYGSREQVIAVDPRIINLGRTVIVSGYGRSRAVDTGSAIKGYRIDVWYDSCSKARAWGVRNRRVWW